MTGIALPRWSGHDLVELLTLAPAKPVREGLTRLRNRFGDANAHDRAYGWQDPGPGLDCGREDCAGGA